MLKVAITGNIASGKSAVETFLKAKKLKVLDTDKVTHDLQEKPEVIEQIATKFKDFDILESGGKISRSKLGAVVFNDVNLRKNLENILHPMIKDEVRRFFRKNEGEKIAFVSVPLLFESGFDKLFDKIIFVYTDDKIRLQRLMKRNNLSKEEANLRIKSQMPQEEKVKKSDFVLHNNTTLENLKKEINALLDKIL